MKLHFCVVLCVFVLGVYGQRQSANSPEKLGAVQARPHSSRGRTRFTQTSEYQETIPDTRPAKKPAKSRSETRIIESHNTPKPIVYATSRRAQDPKRTQNVVSSTIKPPTESNYEVEEIFDDVPRQSNDQYHYSRSNAEIAAQNEQILSAQRVHLQSRGRKQNYQETLDNVLQSTKTAPSRQGKPRVASSENRLKTRLPTAAKPRNGLPAKTQSPKIDQSYSRVTEIAQTSKPDAEPRVIEVTENEPDISYAEFLQRSQTKQKVITRRPEDSRELHYRTGRRIQSIIEPVRDVKRTDPASDLRTPKGRGNKKAYFDVLTERKRPKALDSDAVNIASTRGRGRLAITDIPEYLSYMKRVEPTPPKSKTATRRTDNESVFISDAEATQEIRSGSIILPLMNMELQKTGSLETAASRRTETKVPAESTPPEATFTVRSRNIRSTTEKLNEPRSEVPARRGRARVTARPTEEPKTSVSRNTARRNPTETRTAGRGDAVRTGRRQERVEQSTQFPSRGSRRPTKSSSNEPVTRSAGRRSSKSSTQAEDSPTYNNYPDKMPSNVRVVSSTEAPTTPGVSSTTPSLNSSKTEQVTAVDRAYPADSKVTPTKSLETMEQESSEKVMNIIITAQTPTVATRGRRPTTTSTDNLPPTRRSIPRGRGESAKVSSTSATVTGDAPRSLRRGNVKASTTLDSANLKREINRGRGSAKAKKINDEDEEEESDNYPEPFKALLKKKKLGEEHHDGSRSPGALSSSSRTNNRDDSARGGAEKVIPTLTTKIVTPSSAAVSFTTPATPSTTKASRVKVNPSSSGNRYRGRVLPKTIVSSTTTQKPIERIVNEISDDPQFATNEKSTIRPRTDTDFTVKSRRPVANRFVAKVATSTTEKPVQRQYNTIQRNKPTRKVATKDDFDNNVIPATNLVDSAKYTTPNFNNVRQISPTPESGTEETTFSQNSPKKTRNFVPKSKSFQPSTSGTVDSGYKKKSPGVKQPRNTFTTQASQAVVKPSDHKFSARYRSDLLRSNNFRITSTPSYRPTVPVIHTSQRNSKSDMFLNDNENDLEILTVIPSRIPKLYSANLVLDETENTSTTTSSTSTTEKVTIITPESTSNTATTLLTITTTEHTDNHLDNNTEKLTTTPEIITTFKTTPTTTTTVGTTPKIITTTQIPTTIPQTTAAPTTTVRTTPRVTATTQIPTTTLKTTAAPTTTVRTTPRVTTTTQISTTTLKITTVPTTTVRTTPKIIATTQTPTTTPAVLTTTVRTTPRTPAAPTTTKKAAEVTTTSTQKPRTTIKQFYPTYTTTVKPFITEKIYTAESAPPNFLLTSLLSNYINNPTVTTKFQPETTRSYSSVSELVVDTTTAEGSTRATAVTAPQQIVQLTSPAPTSLIAALRSILSSRSSPAAAPSVSNLSLLPLTSTTEAEISLDTASSDTSTISVSFTSTTSTTTPPSSSTPRTHTAFPTAWAPAGYVPRFAARPSIAALGTPSSSTSTTTTAAPNNDYYVFGILPNNTVVRKKPRLLTATTSSPFIVFGIFPNNTIVRKYPNGTIVPDENNNDVEITDLSANNLQYSLQTGINITTPTSATTALNNYLITTPNGSTTTSARVQEDNIQDNLVDTVRKITPSTFQNPDASASTHILSLTTTKSPKTTEPIIMSTTIIPPFMPLEPKLPTLAEILGPKVVEAYKGIVNETRSNRTASDIDSLSILDINRMNGETVAFKNMAADQITTARPASTVNWKPIQGVPFTALPASEFYTTSTSTTGATSSKSKMIEFIENNQPQSFTSSTPPFKPMPQTTEVFLGAVKSADTPTKPSTTTVRHTTARPTRMRHKSTTTTPKPTTEKPTPSTRRTTTTQRRPAKVPVTTVKAIDASILTTSKLPSTSTSKLPVKEQSLVDELAFLNSLREASSVITQKPNKDQEELANRIIALAIGNQNKPITSSSTLKPQESSIFNLLESIPSAPASTTTNRTPKNLKPTNSNKITADEIKTFQEDLQFLKLLQDSGLAGSLGAAATATKAPLVTSTGKSNEALLAALLKEQGIGPPVSKNTNQLLQDLQLAALLDQIVTPAPKPKPKPTKRRPVYTTTPRPIFPLFQGVRNWLVGAFVGPEQQFQQQQQGRRPSVSAVAVRPRPRPTTTEDPFDNDLSFLPQKASSTTVKTVKKPSLQSAASPNIFSDEFDEDVTVLKERPRAISKPSANLEEIPATQKPKPRPRKKPTTTTRSPFDEEEFADIDSEPPQQVRGQLVDAAINVTKAFSQFLGAAIQGAATTFQNFLNSGTRNFGTYLSSGSIG